MVTDLTILGDIKVTVAVCMSTSYDIFLGQRSEALRRMGAVDSVRRESKPLVAGEYARRRLTQRLCSKL